MPRNEPEVHRYSILLYGKTLTASVISLIHRDEGPDSMRAASGRSAIQRQLLSRPLNSTCSSGCSADAPTYLISIAAICRSSKLWGYRFMGFQTFEGICLLNSRQAPFSSDAASKAWLVGRRLSIVQISVRIPRL